MVKSLATTLSLQAQWGRFHLPKKAPRARLMPTRRSLMRLQNRRSSSGRPTVPHQKPRPRGSEIDTRRGGKKEGWREACRADGAAATAQTAATVTMEATNGTPGIKPTGPTCKRTRPSIWTIEWTTPITDAQSPIQRSRPSTPTAGLEQIQCTQPDSSRKYSSLFTPICNDETLVIILRRSQRQA